jgi:hypothetical protein
MRAAGATVRHAGDAVRFGSTDEEWLALVGKNGWIAIMRDRKIRRRHLELAMLKAADVMAFAFTGGEATARDTAAAVCPRLIKFANMSVSEPRPFLYTFGASGLPAKVKL